MIRRYTDSELAETLKSLTVIADTREQVNGHILKYLEEKSVPVISHKLDVGDYSAQIGKYSFERSFAVERKHNLDELCGNMTADRDRFQREFLRAKAFGTKVYLLIEDASWDDVMLGNYRSKMTPKSLRASLMAWQAEFNVTVVFARHEHSPVLIHELLVYSARKELLYGRSLL